MAFRVLLFSAFFALGFSRVDARAADSDFEDDSTPDAFLAPAGKPRPFSEKGPRDLKTYLDAGTTPNYIRIDIKGYNVRTSPAFTRADKNVDFQTDSGDLFVVKSVKKQHDGAAVEITVDGESRWVYVPFGGKNEFEFCESEACFSAMAQTLDFLLKGTGVNTDQAQTCGITSGPEGLVLPKGAAEPRRDLDPIKPVIAKVPPPLPPTRPAPAPAPAPSGGGVRISGQRPLWETARGAQGVQWTQMLGDSLDKWGQGLLNQRNISDAAAFCPNFSRLTQDQKKEFWIDLFAGIARSESSFHTTTPAFNEANQTNVYRGPIQPSSYSMGLFQLSYSSAGGYRPGCRIDYARDRGKDISDPSLTIYDVKTQMDCAVTVMNRWVSRDGGVGLSSSRGGARFWSTLRSSNPATRDVIASTRRNAACWK